MIKSKIKCLFATPDEALLKSLKESKVMQSFECYWAKSGSEAQGLIKDNAYQLNVCFIDPILGHPNGLDVVKFCHRYQAAVSIYLFSAEDTLELDLSKLGIAKFIPHQTSIEEIAKVIEPYKVEFNSDEALKISQKFNDKEGTELTAVDKEFMPVQAANFISAQKSFFDLYIRLSSGKFIKILNAGDDFKFERILNYLEKGVIYFFIRKDSHKTFVDYVNLTVDKIIKVNKVSLEVKNKQLLFLGEETTKIFSSIDITPENLLYAVEFVDKLHRHLKTIKDQNLIGKFLQNILLFEHCSGVAFIAGLIAKGLEIDSQKSISVLGVASILHDIGLYRYKDEFSTGYDDIEFFDEEKIEARLDLFRLDRNVPTKDKLEQLEKIYENHPMKGAAQVSQVQDIDPIVAQIISQHHMRRNGEGLNKKNKKEVIHPLSEIVGIADEFTKQIKLIKNEKNNYNLETILNKLNDGFSTQTTRALRDIIFPSQKNKA